ncbi:MAG: aminomethyltransferase family protein [Acidobacteriota bacterium]|nr:aminomethyltransferase family protein [Acidobacteriota bacterium]
MSETIEPISIRTSPLDAVHRRHGATFEERDGWSIPQDYGDVAAEYAAVRSGGGAGLFDLSSRGRIEVSGGEAVMFLNGLITNDVKTLADGAWMVAAFPNVQGRLIATARVIRRGETFLFDTEAATHASVLKTLGRFTLAGDFHVADITHRTVHLSVQGAGAARVVGALLGEAAGQLVRQRVIIVSWREASVTVMRTTHTAEDGFDLFVEADHGAEVWEASMQGGARPAGSAALEILRVEAGVARFGVDMNETNVVLEAALDDAVSYTKGCYVGQEIIARIHWRGHVAKRLSGLVFDDEVTLPVPPESKIRTVDGREIGRITSSVFSPALSKTIALGFVKYDYLAAGTEVRVIVGEAERPARVADVPLVRGSWLAETSDTEGANA